MSTVWKATDDILELIDSVKKKHHCPRLQDADFVACFDDCKPFVKNKLNLGKVSKFSNLAKLWQNKNHDFCFIIPIDLWRDILSKSEQKEAYIDLLLSRCTMEFMPSVVEVNGKKEKVKDDWGRIQYTETPKLDSEGNYRWIVLPLDLEIYTENVRRYGLWLDQFLEFKSAIQEKG